VCAQPLKRAPRGLRALVLRGHQGSEYTPGPPI
jgi:hypothetical protein